VAADARGFPRADAVSSIADIGAYEFVPLTPSIVVVR
jgi:hypothetical protein